ncbi:MAG: DNA-deoxyinosine glycosylase [Anaerovoracaceae bacterium]
MEREIHEHGFGPIFDADSRILILGSFPSVKSREQNFFYGHPQNRFWKVMAALTGDPLPETVEEKKAFLLRNGVALYDVIEKCSIIGSGDSSIEDAVPADITPILSGSRVGGNIYTNGGKAYELYREYIEPVTGIRAVKLPSTSSANARFSLEKLVEEWRSAIDLG